MTLSRQLLIMPSRAALGRPRWAQGNHLCDCVVHEFTDPPCTTSDRVVGEIALTITLPPSFALTGVRLPEPR